MKLVTTTSKDSMGLDVSQTVAMLEPKDFTMALEMATRDFQEEIRKLVDRGLDLNRFIFTFRAEKDAGGKMMYDRFFTDFNPAGSKS